MTLHHKLNQKRTRGGRENPHVTASLKKTLNIFKDIVFSKNSLEVVRSLFDVAREAISFTKLMIDEPAHVFAAVVNLVI